jgi:uncharacterized protein YggE
MKISGFFTSVLLLSGTIFISVPLSPLLANEIQKVLIVDNQGSESSPTDITEAEVTIQIQAETSEQVEAAIASQNDFLVEYLRSQGAEKLQVNGLQVESNYKDEKQIESYTGTNTINFQHPSDHEQVSEILDKAIDESRSIDSDDWLASFFSYQIVTSEQNP